MRVVLSSVRPPSESWDRPGAGGGAQCPEDPSFRWGDGVLSISAPAAIATLPGDHLLIEGGAHTAASFLRAGLVDRLLLYRAPILIGGGKPALGDIGLTDLATAHGRWHLADARQLGADRLEVYERP